MSLGREAGKPELDIESRERVAEAPAQEVRRRSTEAQRRATGRHCFFSLSGPTRLHLTYIANYVHCTLFTLFKQPRLGGSPATQDQEEEKINLLQLLLMFCGSKNKY